MTLVPGTLPRAQQNPFPDRVPGLRDAPGLSPPGLGYVLLHGGIVCCVQQALQLRQYQQVFGPTGGAFGSNQAWQIERPHFAVEGRQPHAACPDLFPASESRNFGKKVDSPEICIEGEDRTGCARSQQLRTATIFPVESMR